MLKSAVISFFTLTIIALLPGSLSAAPAPELPAAVARIGEKTIPRSAIEKKWQEILKKLSPDTPEETLQQLMQSLADEVIWKNEILDLLAKAYIPVNRETADQYLLEYRNTPGFPRETLDQMTHLADSPEFQLKAAIHFFVHKSHPDAAAASAAEIEQAYRSSQMRFYRPGQLILGIIRTANEEDARKAAAALLQGTDFNTVARKFDPQGGKHLPTPDLLAAAEKLQEKQLLYPIRQDKYFLVVQLQKRLPASFVPLQEAAPLLKLEIEAAKEARLLTVILQKQLSNRKIRYGKLIFSTAPFSK